MPIIFNRINLEIIIFMSYMSMNLQQEVAYEEGKLSAIKQTEPLNFRGKSLIGQNLSEMDLAGADFSGADLSGADLTRANLKSAKFFKTKLQDTTLIGADLSDAELTGANLSGAHLEDVIARNAGMGICSLQNAKLFNANLEGATLSKANLKGADLRCANLKNSRIREADLSESDFTNSVLQSADLSLTNVSGASFNNSDMRDARLRLIKGFQKASWIGVDIRNINFAGAYQLRRFIADQNYLKEFRESDKLSSILYYFWWISSNCGRSMTRWCLWIFILSLFFSGLYMLVGVDFGPYHTWFSPLYFSIVTLTTLGFGDVIPATASAQIVAVLEVITGYLMLGGLLSILSNKMARRAE
jgi:uncharacterized protein YjbI with pentapeptide repeats